MHLWVDFLTVAYVKYKDSQWMNMNRKRTNSCLSINDQSLNIRMVVLIKH